MNTNVVIAFQEAKHKLFELILIPVEFWFNLPKIVHFITYTLIVWFACFIAYIIYVNRGKIFHKV